MLHLPQFGATWPGEKKILVRRISLDYKDLCGHSTLCEKNPTFAAKTEEICERCRSFVVTKGDRGMCNAGNFRAGASHEVSEHVPVGRGP